MKRIFTICAFFFTVVVMAQDDGELPEPPEPPVPAAPIPGVLFLSLIAIGYAFFLQRRVKK